MPCRGTLANKWHKALWQAWYVGGSTHWPHSWPEVQWPALIVIRQATTHQETVRRHPAAKQPDSADNSPQPVALYDISVRYWGSVRATGQVAMSPFIRTPRAPFNLPIRCSVFHVPKIGPRPLFLLYTHLSSRLRG